MGSQEGAIAEAIVVADAATKVNATVNQDLVKSKVSTEQNANENEKDAVKPNGALEDNADKVGDVLEGDSKKVLIDSDEKGNDNLLSMAVQVPSTKSEMGEPDDVAADITTVHEIEPEKKDLIEDRESAAALDLGPGDDEVNTSSDATGSNAEHTEGSPSAEFLTSQNDLEGERHEEKAVHDSEGQEERENKVDGMLAAEEDTAERDAKSQLALQKDDQAEVGLEDGMAALGNNEVLEQKAVAPFEVVSATGEVLSTGGKSEETERAEEKKLSGEDGGEKEVEAAAVEVPSKEDMEGEPVSEIPNEMKEEVSQMAAQEKTGEESASDVKGRATAEHTTDVLQAAAEEKQVLEKEAQPEREMKLGDEEKGKERSNDDAKDDRGLSQEPEKVLGEEASKHAIVGNKIEDATQRDAGENRDKDHGDGQEEAERGQEASQPATALDGSMETSQDASTINEHSAADDASTERSDTTKKVEDLIPGAEHKDEFCAKEANEGVQEALEARPEADQERKEETRKREEANAIEHVEVPEFFPAPSVQTEQIAQGDAQIAQMKEEVSAKGKTASDGKGTVTAEHIAGEEEVLEKEAQPETVIVENKLGDEKEGKEGSNDDAKDDGGLSKEAVEKHGRSDKGPSEEKGGAEEGGKPFEIGQVLQTEAGVVNEPIQSEKVANPEPEMLEEEASKHAIVGNKTEDAVQRDDGTHGENRGKDCGDGQEEAAEAERGQEAEDGVETSHDAFPIIKHSAADDASTESSDTTKKVKDVIPGAEHKDEFSAKEAEEGAHEELEPEQDRTETEQEQNISTEEANAIEHVEVPEFLPAPNEQIAQGDAQISMEAVQEETDAANQEPREIATGMEEANAAEHVQELAQDVQTQQNGGYPKGLVLQAQTEGKPAEKDEASPAENVQDRPTQSPATLNAEVDAEKDELEEPKAAEKDGPVTVEAAKEDEKLTGVDKAAKEDEPVVRTDGNPEPVTVDEEPKAAEETEPFAAELKAVEPATVDKESKGAEPTVDEEPKQEKAAMGDRPITEPEAAEETEPLSGADEKLKAVEPVTVDKESKGADEDNHVAGTKLKADEPAVDEEPKLAEENKQEEKAVEGDRTITEPEAEEPKASEEDEPVKEEPKAKEEDDEKGPAIYETTLPEPQAAGPLIDAREDGSETQDSHPDMLKEQPSTKLTEVVKAPSVDVPEPLVHQASDLANEEQSARNHEEKGHVERAQDFENTGFKDGGVNEVHAEAEGNVTTEQDPKEAPPNENFQVVKESDKTEEAEKASEEPAELQVKDVAQVEGKGAAEENDSRETEVEAIEPPPTEAKLEAAEGDSHIAEKEEGSPQVAHEDETKEPDSEVPPKDSPEVETMEEKNKDEAKSGVKSDATEVVEPLEKHATQLGKEAVESLSSASQAGGREADTQVTDEESPEAVLVEPKEAAIESPSSATQVGGTEADKQLAAAESPESVLVEPKDAAIESTSSATQVGGTEADTQVTDEQAAEFPEALLVEPKGAAIESPSSAPQVGGDTQVTNAEFPEPVLAEPKEAAVESPAEEAASDSPTDVLAEPKEAAIESPAKEAAIESPAEEAAFDSPAKEADGATGAIDPAEAIELEAKEAAVVFPEDNQPANILLPEKQAVEPAEAAAEVESNEAGTKVLDEPNTHVLESIEAASAETHEPKKKANEDVEVFRASEEENDLQATEIGQSDAEAKAKANKEASESPEATTDEKKEKEFSGVETHVPELVEDTKTITPSIGNEAAPDAGTQLIEVEATLRTATESPEAIQEKELKLPQAIDSDKAQNLELVEDAKRTTASAEEDSSQLTAPQSPEAAEQVEEVEPPKADADKETKEVPLPSATVKEAYGTEALAAPAVDDGHLEKPSVDAEDSDKENESGMGSEMVVQTKEDGTTKEDEVVDATAAAENAGLVGGFIGAALKAIGIVKSTKPSKKKRMKMKREAQSRGELESTKV